MVKLRIRKFSIAMALYVNAGKSHPAHHVLIKLGAELPDGHKIPRVYHQRIYYQ